VTSLSKPTAIPAKEQAGICLSQTIDAMRLTIYVSSGRIPHVRSET
jgi:hypothetical protein